MVELQELENYEFGKHKELIKNALLENIDRLLEEKNYYMLGSFLGYIDDATFDIINKSVDESLQKETFVNEKEKAINHIYNEIFKNVQKLIHQEHASLDHIFLYLNHTLLKHEYLNFIYFHISRCLGGKKTYVKRNGSLDLRKIFKEVIRISKLEYGQILQEDLDLIPLIPIKNSKLVKVNKQTRDEYLVGMMVKLYLRIEKFVNNDREFIDFLSGSKKFRKISQNIVSNYIKKDSINFILES